MPLPERITIDCLLAPGCSARSDTLASVQDAVAELGIVAEIRTVVVRSPDEALQQRFLGSPSVRVNGRDIEPGADSRTDFGMG